jgi:hypothetical protein
MKNKKKKSPKKKRSSVISFSENHTVSDTQEANSVNPSDTELEQDIVESREPTISGETSICNTTASTLIMPYDKNVNNQQIAPNNSEIEIDPWQAVRENVNQGEYQSPIVQDISIHHRVNSSDNKLVDPTFDRKQCVVIHGITESTAEFSNDRILCDLDKFQRCLELMLNGNEHVTVRKAFRLGKPNNDPSATGRPRPLKIILASENQAQLLLRRKSMLRHLHPSVFFQPDYTQIERDKLKLKLRELKFRKECGERNLRILNGEIVASRKMFLWRQPITMRGGCEREKID